MRASRELHNFMTGTGALVLPQVFSIPRALDAFDDDGNLTDDRALGQAEVIAARLVDMASRLA